MSMNKLTVFKAAKLAVITLILSYATIGNSNPMCAELFEKAKPLEISDLGPQTDSSILQFLKAARPKYELVEDVIRTLELLDTTLPVNQVRFASLAKEIRVLATRLVKADLNPNTSEAALNATSNKLRLLNMPSLRNLLPETLQIEVGRAAWIYRRAIWDQDLNRVQKVERVSKQLRAPLPNSALASVNAAIIPNSVEVVVNRQSLLQSKSDSIILAIDRKGFCSSLLHSSLPKYVDAVLSVGGFVEGQVVSVLAPRPNRDKNFTFIVDDQGLPLKQIIFSALTAAEKSGHTSVAIPALRTGYSFGAKELSYHQIISEISDGLTQFYKTNPKNLQKIEFSVLNNDALANRLENTFKAARETRERSLRYDMREAVLSGKGIRLTPSPVRPQVLNRTSPIYGSILKPWSLEHLSENHVPVRIGSIKDKVAFGKDVVSVLNMPIKMPQTDFRLPVELAQFKEMIQKMIDHEAEINPDLDSFYAYITVDNSLARAGTTHRRGGIHIDGVQGARYPVKIVPEHTYSSSNTLGTIFYNQTFNLKHLDPATQHVHAELERQARPENQFITKDFELYFWDSYSVHEANQATRDVMRTFVRIEFSKKIYDGEGDTVSPLFKYNWPRIPRPIPDKLDDSPPGGPEPI